TLSGDGFYDLGNDFAFGEWRDSLPREIEGAPFERHVEAGLGNLRRIYRSIAAGFGGKIDSGLSGGYDSRLTLALLREQGVTPALHVYGKSDDPDVRVATEIARGEGLTLEHVDKSMRPATSAEDFPAVVADNCHALDGCPPDGIFDGGADVETRRERCAGGELMLNGGGGEIFRNFFYLPDRSLTVRAFLWSFYSRYDPSWCTDRFSEEAYLTRLGDKITADLGTTGGKLRRAEIELIYPLFRCRYWMGKNNSNNNRFGWALTPFIDYRTVGGAVRVPIDYKSYGRLQAELIRRIDPRLAGYPSVYGHPFAAPPPLGRRVKELLSIARPPLLRRYLYRIKYRRPQPRGRYLDDRFVHRVVDPGFPFLSRFFKLDRINDPAVYNRVCTLEYLFERHDPSDAPV
ncbi:MAG TPA: hypothetical protein VD788_10020, partial [Candidatus Polarisedimenticolaceae bacterium]|nr:hypothetical protein [Candidatus Polarisedimenticolaceae bacterium]